MNHYKLLRFLKLFTIIIFFSYPLYSQNNTRTGEEELKKAGINFIGLSCNLIKEETADNIKLIRDAQKDEKLKNNNIITLSYRDLFKDEPLKSVNKSNPVLNAGDILIIPISPERTFWDNIKDVSVIVSPLLAIGTLIITIITLSKQ